MPALSYNCFLPPDVQSRRKRREKEKKKEKKKEYLQAIVYEYTARHCPLCEKEKGEKNTQKRQVGGSN